MAQVLVLQRQDGTTETAHIGSPYLAVMFEDAHHRPVDTAEDNAWMAYFDLHNEPPPSGEVLREWLKQFIGTEIVDYHPDPTTVTTNGSPPPDESSPT